VQCNDPLPLYPCTHTSHTYLSVYLLEYFQMMDTLLDTSSSDMNANRKISISKYRKKQAANDAQLLMNRIALLQKEEERARKKVDQTKERALEILAMREENERRTKEWMQAAAEEQQIREEIHKKNIKMEEKSRSIKKKQVDEVIRKKRHDVERIREEKQQLRKEMLHMKAMDVKRKQAMRREVRIRENEARRKREEEKRLHEQRVKEFYEARAREEEAEALRAEKLVKKLEKKEREWVEKLRAAQQVQETAFVDLESALARVNTSEHFPLHEPNTLSPNGRSRQCLSSSGSGNDMNKKKTKKKPSSS